MRHEAIKEVKRLEPNIAFSYLSSLTEILKRRSGEKQEKKYNVIFEGVKNPKQLGLWLNLKGKTRIKLENYIYTIPGVELTKCAKSANLSIKGSRLRNGSGVCVFVENQRALKELVVIYYNIKQSIDDREKSSESLQEKAISEAKTDTEKNIQYYKDYGEVPNDSISELNSFSRKVRKGQTKFRDLLIHLYDGKCSVTGTSPVSVLEAAHIYEHSKSGINNSDNGLLLRADIHLLFDEGLFKINPDNLKLVLSPTLKGTVYWKLHDTELRPRIDGSYPGKEYLLKRWYSK